MQPLSEKGSFMKPRTLYLILCLAGTLLPYSHIVTFLRQDGGDFPLFFERFYSTQGGGIFGMEVVVSLVVLWMFIFIEGRRARMKRLWLPVVASVLVGVSLGLPLFLYMRENRLQGSMWSGGRCEV
jgi:hypothetical protein